MRNLLPSGFLLLFIMATTSTPAHAQTDPEAPEPIVYYDMTSLASVNLGNAATRRSYWDQTHLVTSLQGIVNRAEPRLFIRYNRAQDDFWWARMTEPGGWLNDRPIETITTLSNLLARFSTDYKGAVVWDERVYATSNLASTIAGCSDLLCFRYDEAPGSVYQQYVASGTAIPVVVKLMADDGSPLFKGTGTIPGTHRASTGSAKNDAHVWMIEKFVKTGLTDPHRLGYYMDAFWLQSWASAGRENHTINNHDFVIARRGAFFDLNVWDDEPTVDDPNQPPGTDVKTLKELLRACYDRFGGNGVIHAAGFVPWAYKYTNHHTAGGTHEPVPTEWKYAEILSCYNAFMDADAIGLSNMANASFFQHYPLEARYPQNPGPSVELLKARGILNATGQMLPKKYYAHYVGDYDAAAWLYQQMPTIWTDPARGTLPITWAFNPNLSERFAFGLAWMRATMTENDYFVAGDSGAGYLNPGNLSAPRPHSGLPSGMAAWEAHCKRFFDQWDLTVTGFVIDGYARGLTAEGMDAYARFSPGGIVAQKVDRQGVHNNMPYLRMGLDLPSDIPGAAAVIKSHFQGNLTQFTVCRSILKKPSWYAGVDAELKRLAGGDVVIVDMITLLWLAREYQLHPEIHQWPFTPYRNAAEISARPNDYKGLDIACGADGPCEFVDKNGVSAWKVAAHQPPYYIYFSADDAFYTPGTNYLDVEIEYFDDGSGVFELQYDSTDPGAPVQGAYKGTRQVQRRNTGQWRRETFRIKDANFQNRQNLGADFRFYSGGPDWFVHEVVVRRVPDEANMQMR